ncbi:MAG: hypothetical protein B5M52_00170, partial [Helicobacteraceae bacterium 4484_230]
MHYYQIAFPGSPLEPLTYHFDRKIDLGRQVNIVVRNRSVRGIIVSYAEKPVFDTIGIIEVSNFFFTSPQMHFAHFVAQYYFCSLGEALGLFVPFLGGGEKG